MDFVRSSFWEFSIQLNFSICDWKTPIFHQAIMFKILEIQKLAGSHSSLHFPTSQPPPTLWVNEIHSCYSLTFRCREPILTDFASADWYVSHKPVSTCCMKHIESPYFISGAPIPSTSFLVPISNFSWWRKKCIHEQ